MRKRLRRVGNSLAVILDKPICKLVGIGPNTELEVTSDGRRIIIDPIRTKLEPPPLTASELDALPVFMALVDRFGMDQDRFAQLHHAKMRMFAYAGGLKAGLIDHATDDDRVTFRRFEACLRALKRGASWDDAMIVALHAEPKPGDQNGQPGAKPSAEPAAEPVPEPGIEAGIEPSWDLSTVAVDPSVYAEDDAEEIPPDGVEVSWG